VRRVVRRPAQEELDVGRPQDAGQPPDQGGLDGEPGPGQAEEDGVVGQGVEGGDEPRLLGLVRADPRQRLAIVPACRRPRLSVGDGVQEVSPGVRRLGVDVGVQVGVVGVQVVLIVSQARDAIGQQHGEGRQMAHELVQPEEGLALPGDDPVLGLM